MNNKAFTTSRGTVGYVLQANKTTIDNIAMMNKAQAIITLKNIFDANADCISKEYATEVLLNVSKKKSSQDILIYLYNILLAQSGNKVIQCKKGV